MRGISDLFNAPGTVDGPVAKEPVTGGANPAQRLDSIQSGGVNPPQAVGQFAGSRSGLGRLHKAGMGEEMGMRRPGMRNFRR